ncbi:MAG: hypothetical protein J6T45_08665 [Fibrobacterales bacterium]|nr:hypothetical protein [Fibrobacterales bacterium]
MPKAIKQRAPGGALRSSRRRAPAARGQNDVHGDKGENAPIIADSIDFGLDSNLHFPQIASDGMRPWSMPSAFAEIIKFCYIFAP